MQAILIRKGCLCATASVIIILLSLNRIVYASTKYFLAENSAIGFAKTAQQEQMCRQEKLQRAREYYKAGEVFLKDNNYNAADEAFKNAQLLLEELSKDALVNDDVSGVLTGEAKSEFSQNESFVTFGKNQTKVTLSEELWPSLKAWELSKSGNSQAAIEYYLKAINLEPNNTDLRYNLAIEYIKTRQYQLAVKTLKELIKLNPRDALAYYNLGVLYENYFNDKAQALACYRAYVKLAPYSSDAVEVKKWIETLSRLLGEE